MRIKHKNQLNSTALILTQAPNQMHAQFWHPTLWYTKALLPISNNLFAAVYPNIWWAGGGGGGTLWRSLTVFRDTNDVEVEDKGKGTTSWRFHQIRGISGHICQLLQIYSILEF